MNWMEFWLENLPTDKPHEFIFNFYQKFKGYVIPILQELFEQIENEGILLKLFYNASQHYPDPKSRQNSIQKKTTTLN